jgi:hypothetical protein
VLAQVALAVAPVVWKWWGRSHARVASGLPAE